MPSARNSTRRCGALFVVLLVPLLAACAGNEPPAAPPAVRSEASSPTAAAVATARAQPVEVDARAVFARALPDLQGCYAAGLRATPEMADAKLTLEASFDGGGAATCAIAHDDAGFTQDVADCMAEALGRVSLAGVPAQVTLRVVARSSTLALGAPPADSALLASVETVRMPDAFDVLESLDPALRACVQGRRGAAQSMIIAARVDAAGSPECTLATRAGATAECAAKVLRGAKFPPPKRGAGVVVVPLTLQ